jgi:hypothetical protein
MKLWYSFLRRTFLDICIRLIERDLYNTPVKGLLDNDAKHTLFADLFERPDFRQYLVERETRFIHALANNFTPEVKGQRAENMLLFHKAQSAHERRQKRILSLRRGADFDPAPVPSDELVTN